MLAKNAKDRSDSMLFARAKLSKNPLNKTWSYFLFLDTSIIMYNGVRIASPGKIGNYWILLEKHRILMGERPLPSGKQRQPSVSSQGYEPLF